MRLIDGVSTLSGQYDGYVVDLWGVIHDGVTPYPGAIACLSMLKRENRRVVLLSNAPRRASVAIEGLRALGIADDLYDAVVTSGEATHAALSTRADPWFAGLGDRVFHLGPPRDRSVFQGLGLTEAQPEDASFVLNTGPDDETDPSDPAAFDEVLTACLTARLPMLCANPDLTVIRGGKHILCAGALAVQYQDRGGQVRLIGKPDPAIYAGVFATLGCVRNRVLAVGDSLRTDIAGAAAAGIDALWVLGGIHAHQDPAAAAREAATLGLKPSAAIPRLVW